MARVIKQQKRGVSISTHADIDKLFACLNHGTNVGGAAYLQDPDYHAACARWHSLLTPQQKEQVLVVIDAYTHAHRDAAQEIASGRYSWFGTPFFRPRRRAVLDALLVGSESGWDIGVPRFCIAKPQAMLA